MKNLIQKISVIFSIILNRKILKRPDFSEKKIFLQGQLLERENQKKIEINDLKDVEFSVFSQFGEDGIISWVTDKLPNINKVFVEIGTQDYWESNTRYLLKSKKWKGFLFEGSKAFVNQIKSQKIYWQHDLRAVETFVNKDNINSILERHIEYKDIGLLSIDIDGNDYWILREINALKPAIIICEFNSIFGDLFKISVPYNKNFIRSRAHHSNLYFGASIKAIMGMMEKKGYTFIGTGSVGINAFFVKNELMSNFTNKIRNFSIYPAIVREGLDINGKLTHENILSSLKLINDLEVFDFDDNKLCKLKEYNNLYSDNWIKILNESR